MSGPRIIGVAWRWFGAGSPLPMPTLGSTMRGPVTRPMRPGIFAIVIEVAFFFAQVLVTKIIVPTTRHLGFCLSLESRNGANEKRKERKNEAKMDEGNCSCCPLLSSFVPIFAPRFKVIFQSHSGSGSVTT